MQSLISLGVQLAPMQIGNKDEQSRACTIFSIYFGFLISRQTNCLTLAAYKAIKRPTRRFKLAPLVRCLRTKQKAANALVRFPLSAFLFVLFVAAAQLFSFERFHASVPRLSSLRARAPCSSYPGLRSAGRSPYSASSSAAVLPLSSPGVATVRVIAL